MILQYERLRRHYDSSVKQFDIISFLDLAHVLRIWCELIDEVDEIGDVTFKTSSIPKKAMRNIKSHDYFFLHLPDGVTTYSAKHHKTYQGEIYSGPKREKGSMGGISTFGPYGELTVTSFFATSAFFDEREKVKKITQSLQKASFKRVKFSNFMNMPFIYFRLPNHKPSYISRSGLIKRTANEYQGSHSGKLDDEIENIFSGPVKIFMQYKCAGIPVPYFALLHISNEIISNLKFHMKRL